MNNEALKKAEERQRKIIANAEARLRKIAEAAKSEVRAPPPKHKSSIDDGFVDFEVDSFVNEPTKVSPGSLPVTPSSDEEKLLRNSPLKPTNSSSSLSESGSSSSTSGSAPNGFLHNNDLEQLQELLGRTNATNFSNHRHSGGAFGASRFPFQAHTSHMMPPGPSAQSLANGRPLNQMNAQDLNNPFNALSNLAGLSQNPADLSNLLNALSGLASGGAVPQAPPAPAQEDTHPVLKPILNIIVFFVLGILTRIIFQLITLKMNVFAPFLCLAIPLAIMSWGRRPQPMTGLLSAVLLFIRNPRTQTMIISWVRLTTLLRGLSRLFACYFSAFVATHVLFELYSIASDVNTHSTHPLPPSV